MQQCGTACPGMWDLRKGEEKQSSILSLLYQDFPKVSQVQCWIISKHRFCVLSLKLLETTLFMCIAISHSIHHLQKAVLTQSHLSVRSATPQIPIESLEESVQSASSLFCPPVFQVQWFVTHLGLVKLEMLLLLLWKKPHKTSATGVRKSWSNALRTCDSASMTSNWSNRNYLQTYYKYFVWEY